MNLSALKTMASYAEEKTLSTQTVVTLRLSDIGLHVRSSRRWQGRLLQMESTMTWLTLSDHLEANPAARHVLMSMVDETIEAIDTHIRVEST